jgi:hypothetical protein
VACRGKQEAALLLGALAALIVWWLACSLEKAVHHKATVALKVALVGRCVDYTA